MERNPQGDFGPHGFWMPWRSPGELKCSSAGSGNVKIPLNILRFRVLYFWNRLRVIVELSSHLKTLKKVFKLLSYFLKFFNDVISNLSYKLLRSATCQSALFSRLTNGLCYDLVWRWFIKPDWNFLIDLRECRTYNLNLGNIGQIFYLFIFFLKTGLERMILNQQK